MGGFDKKNLKFIDHARSDFFNISLILRILFFIFF